MTRDWIAPEVIQTSAMDCGPAALKCLLEGFGVPVSYGRLREACQTDVDGTSIDTLEEIGAQLGLACEQMMVPVDHVLLPAADILPAILVMRLSNGFTHFVVVWRRHGPLVQIMDPSAGRRWVSTAKLLEETYVHSTSIDASSFSEWARSDEFSLALRGRLKLLGSEAQLLPVLDAARAAPGWRALATLDAAMRMTQAVVRSGGLARGPEAARMVMALADVTSATGSASRKRIPDTYFTARAVPAERDASSADDESEQVLMRGAVLVRVRLKSSAKSANAAEDAVAPPLSPDLLAALAEVPTRAGQHLVGWLREDGLLAMPVLGIAVTCAVLGAALEAVLFRGLFDVGRDLGLVQHRLAAMGAVVVFTLLLLGLELPVVGGVQRLGRRLEVRLRMAFLTKLPRLGDRYLQSRPTSDMAERSHAIHDVRLVPELGLQMVRGTAELVVTTAAIAWIDPRSAPWALAAALVALAIPLAGQPVLVERDLRARSHVGALARFYLDALLGLAPVRTHGAERSVRREHEMLLVEWTRASRALLRATVTTETVQTLAAYAITVPLVMSYLGRSTEPAGVLLLLYWALNLPLIGQDVATTLRQYPAHRNRTLRLLEPLGAIEEATEHATEHATDDTALAAIRDATHEPTHAAARRPRELKRRGVELRVEGASVLAAGHAILENVSLAVAPGEHVAIVGASGAGKSSLLGVLLGWHRPSSGLVAVDGVALDAAHVARIRAITAWVDPAVHLWNRSLLENLRYGARDPRSDSSAANLGLVLHAADLHRLLETLPDGLQTTLGEGGALVSGGEGQRVRLGRALGKKDARLVLLDEPFRGLDRQRRRELLGRARAWWKNATILCVTHDVEETRSFDRVLVVAGGRIVEDGSPSDLASRPDSLYGAMLAEEKVLRDDAWSARAWRRLRLETGRLRT